MHKIIAIIARCLWDINSVKILANILFIVQLAEAIKIHGCTYN